MVNKRNKRKNKITNIREMHTGKDRFEKQDYGRFLTRPGKIDKTEVDKNELATDFSDFEEEENKKEKKVKKSYGLNIVDYLKKNWVEAVLVALIIWLVGSYFEVNRDIGKMEAQANYTEKEIEQILGKYEKIDEKYSNFNQVIGEVKADLKYLKEQLQKVKR